MKKVVVIGAGFSGLSAAASLAAKGFKVDVLEKHSIAGGRARKFEAEGFTFDMGPSWYWMPDVFEKWFAAFDKKPSDYYDLIRLDPSYRVFWNKDESTDLPANYELLKSKFEEMETGAGEKLDRFLKEAEYKYNISMSDLIYKPSKSMFEFAEWKILKNALRIQLFKSFKKHTASYFKSAHINQLMEFPILFLGGTAENTPALYSLMNYADMKLGTWYPMGGMYRVVEGMRQLAESLGVHFHFNHNVEKILTDRNKTTGVRTDHGDFMADYVISSADYHHTESKLLSNGHQNYSSEYWDRRVMAPSSLIFFLGIDKKLDSLEHHNLFFDQDFKKHAEEIYRKPVWPSQPSIYISAPSKTDDSLAPEGMENLMVLIPVAPGLEDTEAIREKYLKLFMLRLEKLTGESILDHIVYQRSYAITDFVTDYNAFKGNAYGLANTLRQTAFLKPKLINKKLPNLLYAGQLSVPGPGVPPALISGQLVASEIINSA